MQIVSGFQKNISYQQCTRCIADTTIPGIKFNTQGVCSLCEFHDRLDAIYPENEEAIEKLNKWLLKIKRTSKNKTYDCVIGLSGGRDSTYLLYLAVKVWRLRVLAVHFNDGFDNPIATENMLNATRILNVDFRQIKSNIKESIDLKLVDLKASTPLLNNGTDIGLGAALYGVANQENIQYILYGQSFRTEGIRPIAWAYFDGDLVRALHKRYGKEPFGKWTPDNPGYNLGLKEISYYVLWKRIRTVAPFYYYPYHRKEAEEILRKELNWVYPGAHYYDDLYWSLITYVHRVKFNIDFRKIAYSALIRESQMDRIEALEAVKQPYVMEDKKVINECLERLNITEEEFEDLLKMPPKNFWDYPNSYSLLRLFKYPIWLLSKLGLITEVVYQKYFGLDFK